MDDLAPQPGDFRVLEGRDLGPDLRLRQLGGKGDLIRRGLRDEGQRRLQYRGYPGMGREGRRLGYHFHLELRPRPGHRKPERRQIGPVMVQQPGQRAFLGDVPVPLLFGFTAALSTSCCRARVTAT